MRFPPRLSPATFLALTRPRPVAPPPAPVPAAPLAPPDLPVRTRRRPPQRLVGGDCVCVFEVAGGMVVMAEVRPDGSFGEEHRVPADRFTAERLERFQRYVQREQGRARLAIVR